MSSGPWHSRALGSRVSSCRRAQQRIVAQVTRTSLADKSSARAQMTRTQRQHQRQHQLRQQRRHAGTLSDKHVARGANNLTTSHEERRWSTGRAGAHDCIPRQGRSARRLSEAAGTAEERSGSGRTSCSRSRSRTEAVARNARTHMSRCTVAVEHGTADRAPSAHAALTSPTSISYSIMPRLHQSTPLSCPTPVITSGAATHRRWSGSTQPHMHGHRQRNHN
jgi:hypothetical protein